MITDVDVENRSNEKGHKICTSLSGNDDEYHKI